MPVSIYFNFDNQSLEVMQFYATVFKTDYEVVFASEDSTKVMHGSMKLLGSQVSFSDIPDGYNLKIGNHVTLSINSTDVELLRNLFHQLSIDGVVQMPLAPTFWSEAYGIVEDKFKTVWQVNLDK